MAAAKADQASVDRALIQSLEDLSFGFAEARHVILLGLVPFFETLVGLILPKSVDAVFRAQLIEQLQSAAAQDMQQPCQLVLHPGQVSAVTQILTDLNMQELAVTSRADQPAHAALIQRGKVETAIDVDALLTGIQDTLAGFIDTTQEHADHG